MRCVLIIAAEEWRYWLRTNLALGAMALFALLSVATAVLTALEIEDQRHTRLHQQAEAEDIFLSQPDRHPHRMVHYGHYVFRTPAPLAIFDPGLNPVTGQSIFLEGHRQNSAMFADSAAGADLGGLASLTPAIVYQLFAPLLIILLGHGALVREREAATLPPLLAQGICGRVLFAGKGLALMSVIVVLLLPVVPAAYLPIAAGESAFTVLSWMGLYLLYFCVWGAMTLWVSMLFKRRSVILATLIGLWLTLTLLVPALALSVVAHGERAAGKIETDLAMLANLRALGDGHNANDPAFAALRADLLKKHGVKSVEELPVNIRGVVAQYAEEKLTGTLNAYAAEQMAGEAKQADRLEGFGWLSPALAVSAASRAIAGTDLDHHHRFLREAERLRYDFVQGLNRVHANQLTYADDIQRSSDAGAERRTRVAADNWALLDHFDFEPAPLNIRIAHASLNLIMLAIWFGGLVGLAVSTGGRITL